MSQPTPHVCAFRPWSDTWDVCTCGKKQRTHLRHANPDPLRRLPHPEPQRHQAPALGGAGEGEAPGDGRAVVRFVGYRVRPLDPDNFAGSVKDLLDGLRHAGLIPGDEPWRIRLETEQVRVRTKAEEKTVIAVTYP